jgi:hypothetical protein
MREIRPKSEFIAAFDPEDFRGLWDRYLVAAELLRQRLWVLLLVDQTS